MEKFIKFMKSYVFWTIVFAFWTWFFSTLDSCSANNKKVYQPHSHHEEMSVKNQSEQETIKNIAEISEIISK